MDKWQDHAEAETEPEAEAPRLDRTQILFAALASAAFCMALFAGLQWWQSGGDVEYRPVAPAPVDGALRQANPQKLAPGTVQHRPLTAAELVQLDDAARRALQAQLPARDASTVYLAERGSRYHAEHCAALKSGKHPLSLTEAQTQGYQPCAVCKPEGWAGYIETPNVPRPIETPDVRAPYVAPVQAAPPPMSQREKAMRAAAEHEAAMDADYSQRRNNAPVGAKTTIKRPSLLFPTRLDGGIHTSN